MKKGIEKISFVGLCAILSHFERVGKWTTIVACGKSSVQYTSRQARFSTGLETTFSLKSKLCFRMLIVWLNNYNKTTNKIL
jgi:hypothetical protein